jgi:hypothetical protein
MNEAAATRERLSEVAEGLRDRVSDAERAVTGSGQHAAIRVSTPPPEATSRPSSSATSSARATVPEKPAPRQTLPSIAPPAPATS